MFTVLLKSRRLTMLRRPPLRRLSSAILRAIILRLEQHHVRLMLRLLLLCCPAELATPLRIHKEGDYEVQPVLVPSCVGVVGGASSCLFTALID